MIDVLATCVGIFGVVFGIVCYRNLWLWARQCQNARIVIGHKKRVQIDAPLTDWLSWANQLSGKQREQGRIVYRNGYVAVAIMRPERPSPPRVLLATIRRTLRARRPRTPPATVPTEPTPNPKVKA